MEWCKLDFSLRALVLFLVLDAFLAVALLLLFFLHVDWLASILRPNDQHSVRRTATDGRVSEDVARGDCVFAVVGGGDDNMLLLEGILIDVVVDVCNFD